VKVLDEHAAGADWRRCFGRGDAPARDAALLTAGAGVLPNHHALGAGGLRASPQRRLCLFVAEEASCRYICGRPIRSGAARSLEYQSNCAKSLGFGVEKHTY
jgi:hypothetical protein